MEKILFDTDIGSDIDDAICLAYLLKQPECQLMGITTVSGEPVARAMLASAVCKAAKKDVPIFPGTDKHILTEQKQPLAKQASALPRWEHEKNFPQNQAVEFLRKTIRENPNEITLLATGPMTNIGLLFAADPEVVPLLKQLVVMCGIFTHTLPNTCHMEWNALCDPYATAIMYNAPLKIHKSIGLDVTFQVQMDRMEVKKNFTADVLQPVLDFSDVWFEGAGLITFHDPLAGATIFNKDICGFEKGNIDVELKSDRLMGLTHWNPDENGRHEVALKVDKDLFFKHYFDVVNG